MMGVSTGKAAVFLAAIFGAGAVSGWVLASKITRQRLMTPPRSEEIAASFRESLHSRLHLTPEQARQIDAIIERSTKEMQAIHGEHTRRILQGVSNRNAQISAVLTPEQQPEFERIEKERREAWRAKEARRSKEGGRDRRHGSRDRRSTNDPARSLNPAPTNTAR